MVNYEDKSDFQINNMVRNVLVLKGDRNFLLDDYCKCPNDAWPIITENKIDFEWLGASVEASDITGKHMHEDLDNNALRACMIVFLKMEADKNE